MPYNIRLGPRNCTTLLRYEFSRKKSRSKGAGEEEKLKYKLKKETKVLLFSVMNLC